MDVADLERVYEAFQDFHDYFAPAFGRQQWREHSRHYLQGLLVQSQERRNAENLSEISLFEWNRYLHRRRPGNLWPRKMSQ